MKLKLLLIVSAAALLLAGCKKEAQQDLPTYDPTSIICKLEEPTDITTLSITLNGTIEIADGVAGDVECGFVYSRTSVNPVADFGDSKTVKTAPDENGRISLTLSDLTPDSWLYARVYAKWNGYLYYSAVATYTTKMLDIDVTTDRALLDFCDVGFSASITLKEDKESSKSVFFLYSPNLATLKTDGIKVESVLRPDMTFTAQVEGLDLETAYFYVACVEVYGRTYYSEISRVDTAGPTKAWVVDLGYSDILWAPCNLGASNPEEYGGYFQWASTEDVSDLSISVGTSTCPYFGALGYRKYVGLTQEIYAKGGFYDNRSVLEPQDDAAAVILKNNWRIPTSAEMRTLAEGYRWKFTRLNGVNGFLVAGTKTGFTDKAIFLPAAGIRLGNELMWDGNEGNYWSSSPGFESSDCAYCINATIQNRKHGWNLNYRYLASSIRPVLPK